MELSGLDESSIIGLIAWGLAAAFLLKRVLSRTVKFCVGIALLLGSFAMLMPEAVGLERLALHDLVPKAMLYGGTLAGAVLVLGSFTQRVTRVARVSRSGA